MSTFEKYDEPGKSEAYAARRLPDSADVFTSFIKHLTGRPLEDLQFLDAGCGTGNYGAHMLQHGASYVTFLDGSERQLVMTQAQLDRLGVTKDRYHCVQACLPDLPITEESVDVIMLCQVLHHIEQQKRQSIFKEAFKRLRPGGVICVAQSTPIQMEVSHYAYQPWKDQLAKYGSLQPRMSNVLEMMNQEGFSFKAALAISHKPMCLEPGNDVVAAVSDPDWRASDSFFSHVTPQELARGIEMLKDRNLVEKWRLEAEGIGVETAYIAVKPPVSN